MEKEIVTKFDLESAFKALDEIEIPAPAQKGRCLANRVNLQERLNAQAAHEVLVEDYFDINSTDDLEAAKEEREAEVAKAKLARIEKIVDLDAETEEDILPSYVGKIIIQCPQCMTLFYKNEEDIEKSEETPEVVNINEICQHCGNSSGYNLIGRVGGIEESEADNFDLDEIDENELDLDFPEEANEETTDEAAEEEEFNLDDLDLDLPEEEEAEEEPEEVEESLNNSELLAKIEKDNELKTDEESEHLTLNEDAEIPTEDSELDEDLSDWYRKTFDKPASVEAQQAWEDELNGEMGEISDKRRKELEKKFAQQRDWENRHKEPEADDEAKELPETETVAVESLNNSELLKDAEKDSDLKSEIESENLTLNEEVEAAPCKLAFIDISGSLEAAKEATTEKALADGYELKDIKYFNDPGYTTVLEAAKDNCQIAVYTNNDYETNCPELKELENVTIYENLEEGVGDWVRKTFDKPASIKTQQSWEDELNGEMGEISDKRRAELEKKFAQQRDWEARHAEPEVEAEEEKELEKVLTEDAYDELLDELWSGEQPTEAETEAILDDPRFSEALADAEDLDEESINKHLTEYFTKVYSNVKCFEATSCSLAANELILEGLIKFNSGNEKTTTFRFESTTEGLVGKNTDLTEQAAFKLSAKTHNKVLITESFKYCYNIEGATVKGSTRV